VGNEFTRIDPTEVEPSLRKPLRAIQLIRRLASRQIRMNESEYHLGILFHALRRLADYDPARPLLPSELARLAHVLLAAAMIYDQIEHSVEAIDKAEEGLEKGIRIDRTNRSVWIDGSRVKLRGHNYDLLCALYDHRGQPRTRKELVEQVFGERYDESDNSQIAKLNTAIRRLRERIEIEPDHPRYLLTETGVGYRLVARPGS
jgi:DNA-binding response OmpR family regulator